MMRTTLKTMLTAAGLLAAQVGALASELPGYDLLPVPVSHRARDLEAAVWYPAKQNGYRSSVGDNPAFHGTAVYQGTAPKKGIYPLVMVSHGSGGNIQNLGWLTGALARDGAIVAGVNHPGSTTGDSSPRRSVRHWDRPKDVGAALDAVLDDPVFGPLVDRERIYVLGFSYGGLTALSLGGARPDKARFLSYCAELGEEALDCEFFRKGGVDLRGLPRTDFEQDLRDPRFSRIVAIDPAFGYAFTDESLAGMTMPVHLVNLGLAPDRWKAIDAGPTGNRLSARLPGASFAEFERANHFTFLGVCKPEAARLLEEEGEDPICDDPEGGDRRLTHDLLIDDISRFLFGRGS
jgi:predicted dienelactone hydrolase